MKIDVTSIILDHLGTLRDVRSGKISIFDIFVFFVTPFAAAVCAFMLKYTFDRDVYNLSVTFFGIFIALLLNIQVGIFAIFQRKWTPIDDKRLNEIQNRKISDRREILTQLNANISYLILFCCFSLVLFLIFFTQNSHGNLAPALSISIYAHFLLTLVMVVKRSHALFQKEYRDSPD